MFCFYELPGRSEPASGYTDVDVRMERKLLPPGVEDGNDPGFSTEELLIRAQGEERLLHTSELQAEEVLWIRLDKGVQFMRHCEDDMEVGNAPDQFGIAFQLPFLFQRSLTAGAGAVVAGDGVNERIAAVFTVADVITELAGLAVHDTGGSLTLFR